MWPFGNDNRDTPLSSEDRTVIAAMRYQLLQIKGQAEEIASEFYGTGDDAPGQIGQIIATARAGIVLGELRLRGNKPANRYTDTDLLEPDCKRIVLEFERPDTLDEDTDEPMGQATTRTP